MFAITIKDVEKALAPKKIVDPATILPPEYYEFLDVFSRHLSDQLPPHRPYDHSIRLQPEAKPPASPLYGMSREELLVLKKYLEDHLAKGFIRPSSSPAASPVLFIRKLGGGL